MNTVPKQSLWDIFKRKEVAGFLFILPAFLYFVFIYYYPILQAIYVSFHDWSPFAARFVGLQMYRKVLLRSVFWHSISITTYFVILSIPLTVIPALLIAILLNSIIRIKLRNTFTIFYFLPFVVSLVAAALIWEWLLNPHYGFVNYLLERMGIPGQLWLRSPTQVIPSLAGINAWSRLGFDVILFLAALQTLPMELYEAAEIDGASKFQRFLHITLPLLNPQIILVVIIELIFDFKIFDQVYVTTQGGPANQSRVIILHLYDTAFKWFKMGQACVIALVIFLLLLSLSLFQWKFFRRTVTY